MQINSSVTSQVLPFVVLISHDIDGNQFIARETHDSSLQCMFDLHPTVQRK